MASNSNSNSNSKNSNELVPRPHRATHTDDSLQFLWAVSYSDLLMVLMSFFIVFFDSSMETEKNRYKIVLASLENLKSGQSTPAQTIAPTEAKAPIQSKSTQSVPISSISAILAQNKIDFKKPIGNAEVVVIDFPDNFYHPGEYILNPESKKRLNKVLKLLAKFQDRVQLTLIGHSDQEPLRALRYQKVINSNLSLSNLRASRAAEAVVRFGFNPKRVIAQGNGEFSRNTRSLSIRISEVDLP